MDGQRARAAARPGATRCSRTTPSSVSGCGWRSTPRRSTPRHLLERLGAAVGDDLVAAILKPPGDRGRDRAPARARGRRLARALGRVDGADGSRRPALLALAGDLVRQGVWIIGGDGWAYDIGFGGLDHVLSLGPQRQHPGARHRGLLEHRRPGLEGDAARRRGEVRRRRQGDRQEGPRRDRPRLRQRLRRPGRDGRQRRSRRPRRSLEAEAWPGPSLVIAYSTCIAHGIDMAKSMSHQKDAVKSGYWPLYRFHPTEIEDGQPFKLDSQRRRSRSPTSSPPRPASPCSQRTHPERAAELADAGQADADERWRYYEQLGRDRAHRRPHVPTRVTPDVESDAGYRYDRGDLAMTVDLAHPLPRARAALTDRRLGRSAHRRPRHRRGASRRPASAPSSCRRCSRRRSSTRRSS